MTPQSGKFKLTHYPDRLPLTFGNRIAIFVGFRESSLACLYEAVFAEQRMPAKKPRKVAELYSNNVFELMLKTPSLKTSGDHLSVL
jgi:hypothetical protein